MRSPLAEMPGDRKMSMSIGVASSARRRRRSRGPAHRRRGRAARREARWPRAGALLLRRGDDAARGAHRSRRSSKPRARARSVPPVPGADERGHDDPPPRSRRCRACWSTCRACTSVELDLGVAAPQRDLRPRRRRARSPARRRARSRRPDLPLGRRRRLPGDPRRRAPGTGVDLEALAQAVERAVEEALAPMVSEVLREQPRITVGSARVLGNSLLRPERLTARLITDAAGQRAQPARAQGAPRSLDAPGHHPRRGPVDRVPADRRSRHRATSSRTRR